MILELILNATDHPTAAQIYERARQVLPSVGQATVYRTLRRLVAEDLIREVRVGDVTQYDRRTERHDHVICRRCGCIGDVWVEMPEGILDRAAAQCGFRIEEHHTELFGLCPSCQ